MQQTNTYKMLAFSSTVVLESDNSWSVSVLREGSAPDLLEPSIQVKYLNEAVGAFLRTFIRVYSQEELSDDDRDRLKKYLDRVFEAKDAVTPREPKGGMYLRKYS